MQVSDVNQVIKKFNETKKMMKQFMPAEDTRGKKGKKGKKGRRRRSLPGVGGMSMADMKKMQDMLKDIDK